MMIFLRNVPVALALLAIFAIEASAAPKIDKETCEQLKSEQSKFVQTGILADIERGPAFAKDRLSAERIREIEIYITLDEQIKFGCREATLTGDAIRAGEAARRLELNPDADPTAPPPQPAAPQSKSGSPNETKPDDAPPAPEARPAAEATAKPAVKPKPKPKPAAASKPKPDDAYSPPAGAESTLTMPEEDEGGARTDVP